jgi:hypothetical protein
VKKMHTTRSETTRSQSTTSTSTTSTTSTEIGDGDSDLIASQTRVTSGCDGRHRSSRGGQQPNDTIWHYLQDFKIEYPPRAGTSGAPTVKVFANGLQQVRIRVHLSPRLDDGTYVRVSCDELLARLTLVTYDGGSALPTAWKTEHASNGYEYDEAVISGSPVKEGEPSIVYSPHDNRAVGCEEGFDYVSFDVFVTTTAVNSIRVAASIMPPNSSQAIQTRPGSGGGGNFDSSVNIEGCAKPSIPSSSMPTGYDGFHLSSSVREENGRYRATDWYLSLSYRGKSVALKSWDYGTGPCIWWAGGDWGKWEGFFTIACKQPGSAEWTTDALPATIGGGSASEYFPNPRMNPRTGEIGIVMVGFTENNHFWWGSGGEAPDRRSTVAEVTDKFGNTFRISIFFDGGDVLDVSL